MEKENCMLVLILSVTLSQGFAILSDNRTGDSSDHFVRKRQVIDTTPHANTRVKIRDVFYVVNIQQNGIHACAGTILATQIIITTVTCISEHAAYTAVSGTLSKIRGGITHAVTGILRHPQYVVPLFRNDIALLSINPPVMFRENKNRPIPLFNANTGQLPANTLVTVSGYGLTFQTRRGIGCIGSGRRQRRLIDPNELRSIRLPTLSLQECRDQINEAHHDTDDIICTFHVAKSCSYRERGNPLVYDGHLVGILVSDGFLGNSDIFVSVASPGNRNWILSHMSPEHIPRYIPPAVNPPPHRHINPQDCSRIHSCSDE